MSAYTVLYDACVLYPAPLRDYLIEIAARGLYRAKWSETIHDEWIGNLQKKRPKLDIEKLGRTRALMNATIPDCIVAGFEYLIPALQLPDADDRHVLAAAIHARCDAIITTNIKDFPADYVARFNIEVLHPDEFLYFQFDLGDAAMLSAAQECRKRLKNPPKTAEEYLDILQRQSLPKTVGELRRYVSIL